MQQPGIGNEHHTHSFICFKMAPSEKEKKDEDNK